MHGHALAYIDACVATLPHCELCLHSRPQCLHSFADHACHSPCGGDSAAYRVCVCVLSYIGHPKVRMHLQHRPSYKYVFWCVLNFVFVCACEVCAFAVACADGFSRSVACTFVYTISSTYAYSHVSLRLLLYARIGMLICCSMYMSRLTFVPRCVLMSVRSGMCLHMHECNSPEARLYNHAYGYVYWFSYIRMAMCMCIRMCLCISACMCIYTPCIYIHVV